MIQKTMTISNILVSIANIIVLTSLFPSIRSDQKPHIKTCLMNVLVSIVFVVAFSIIGLWVVVVWNILIGIMWGYLANQVNKRNKDLKYKPNLECKMVDEIIDSIESYD